MLFRKVGFLLISLVLRYPIWALLYITRPFRLFAYIFLVYPGSESDLDGYCPRWLAKSFLFSGKPTIGGIITKGENNIRGLILVIPNTIQECSHDKTLCLKITQKLLLISNLVGANYIAIAGQGPSVIRKHGLNLSNRFVSGYFGAVYSVSKTIEKSIEKHLEPTTKHQTSNQNNISVCVVGKGFIGSRLVEFLNKIGYCSNIIEIGANYNLVSKADVVVVMAPKGDDFLPYIPHVKDGAIIIDYTHPRLRRIPKGLFYKVVVSLKNVTMMPSLPGYKPKWLPGCVIEAIVASKYGSEAFESQQNFNNAADSIGFYPLLVQ